MAHTPSQHLTKEQKVGFALLLLFAILAVGLGFFQMRNTIYGPFLSRKKSAPAKPAFVMDETARLQGIDTDKDGLNDYEELYFYQTSPYLPDTDSDRVGDKEEINTGTDPLCPDSQGCSTRTISEEMGQPKNISTELFQQANDVSDILNYANSVVNKTSSTIDFDVLLNSPQQIRELLLASGKMTEEELSQIDDNTLVQVVQQIMNSGILSEESLAELQANQTASSSLGVEEEL
ncbi:MAG TPA: hypothetical protein DCY48_03735 [Candidatus Magasanikbacteria bacterium]|nr:MAG: hypothetical protein A3I74_04540 [Candidatus Magasanikbacteria bacterium RIFCSPLOWO2_02_FULL_47_16]OGH79476.1 MAG: hypothetical protein A3C10_01510 [Candidatus Magasanikbacteria bacterium RIFCSPHIGHO2_02_FULL_48_18]OGH83506.1 MAG: hypothetical protein A3G08_03995 [Candidatus Magasanikbacteria bacterium RIFCSPLOWO2_12_FULL_47_9b]HAZ28856.1 hypothetical protein [Candidatus Magasanikbacteria bacterium]